MKLHKYVGYGLVIICIIGCFFIMMPAGKRGVVKRYAFELKPLNKVSLTTYTTDTSETDSFPLITASGLHLDSANPKKNRIIAISRDLKKLFSFGDRVVLRNAGKFNGIWFRFYKRQRLKFIESFRFSWRTNKRRSLAMVL